METYTFLDALAPSPELPSHSAAIIERAPLPMVEVLGAEHTICFVNSAFCRLLQKSRGELIGRHFVDMVSNGAKCLPQLDRVYETGEFQMHVEPAETAANPAYWVFALWPVLDAAAKPVRVIIQVTRSSFFHQSAAAMNEALLISGLREHELRDKAEKANDRLKVEVAERRKADKALQEAHAQLRAEAGKLERAVAERTAQLRASVGELEAFAYSLVHDLRAPVRAIHGFTYLALEQAGDGLEAPVADFLKRVISAASRMDSLIQDVLSLHRIISQPIAIQLVDVDRLVRMLIQEQPELFPPQTEMTIVGQLLPMWGHEASLTQCLTNLLSNAAKFSRPGQTPVVRIRSERIAAPRSKPVTLPAVRLWVEDDGIGIAEEAQKKIFGIFVRLNSSELYEGSGIGLSIVSKAIHRMGGRAGVESEVDRGSRFWLELPEGPVVERASVSS